MFYAVVVITLSALSHSVSAGCRVYLNGNLTQNHPPLFLHRTGNQFELLQPTGSYFEWKRGETTVVGCSTTKNVLTETGTGVAQLTCIDGQQFRTASSSGSVDFGAFSCRSTVSGVIRAQEKPCADGIGSWYDAGFEVNGVPFVKYFQVCYNLATSTPIYSEHQLLGASLSHAQINNVRPSFKLGVLTPTVRLTSVYTQREQLERFTTLLGSSKEASKYIDSGSFLAKGHLTPDADAILNNWAAATYFFLNAAPEWQIVNGGNWKRVENAVRKVATQLNDTLQVYTGVYDVLRLPDIEGSSVPITLGGDGSVAVPKWLWKVAVHQPTNAAIAFITLNNPFATNEERLCEDICARHGWHQKEFLELRKGLTYCCAVSDAQNAIKHIPKSIRSKAVLKLQ
ncbi:uncharacterized protein LOC128727485 isoform X1 [Anopheles nili]|uniref:uncharacterized protein LOC128727485 isoform X1 n=1 Tax=Anopheles nili TaxID=185578 RepID=UPI00237C0CF8|nr:uncharacterized protein LOC128727485 isoform X1 [Anopheles nili]